jgi:hypothetical protein
MGISVSVMNDVKTLPLTPNLVPSTHLKNYKISLLADRKELQYLHHVDRNHNCPLGVTFPIASKLFTRRSII